MFNRDSFKVTFASILGLGAPSVNWVVEAGEPLLKLLVLAGQLGVAIVTILYIFRKWKNAAKKQNPRRSRKDNDD